MKPKRVGSVNAAIRGISVIDRAVAVANMAVLVTADVPGQTKEGYDGMLAMLEVSITRAPGFVLHSAHPIEGGWRIIEIWESKEEATEYFAKFVHPNLPPGVKPRRTLHELHRLVRP